jgi:hypothetical protein
MAWLNIDGGHENMHIHLFNSPEQLTALIALVHVGGSRGTHRYETGGENHSKLASLLTRPQSKYIRTNILIWQQLGPF